MTVPENIEVPEEGLVLEVQFDSGSGVAWFLLPVEESQDDNPA
jgi:hypothetical protein